MKLLAVMMLIGVLQLSASVKGQIAEVNMSMQDANLVEFFTEIRNQTEYDFLYNHDLVMSKESVDVDVNGKDLKELLEGVLYQRDLDFQVDDNVIIISERDYVAPLAKPVVQEEKKISGKVVDETGVALPGVSILVKGTNIGTATDIDGKYVLEIPADAKTLVYSFIGMQTQEIAYTGQKVVNVTLGADTEQMAEVVVTGYQTIAKERATGSFQIVKADDLDNVASLDIANKLQGVSPGVRVDDEGQITIRGQATLSAEKSPFIVVNGMPYNGSLSEINSDDIEQLTVLKDAASTSIYGVRGANGVIVITTKNGNTDGKLNISYTNNIQFSEKAKISDLHQLNSKDYADLEWEYYSDKVGLVTYPWYSYKSEIGEIYDRLQNNQISQEEAKLQLDQLASYDNASDVEKAFMQRVSVQKHTLSFNYGTKTNQFYASIAYDEDKGMWKGNKGNNISFNLNDRFKFNDMLALSVSAFGNFRKKELNGANDSFSWRPKSGVAYIRPYVRFKNENGEYVNEANGSYDLAQYAGFENLGLLPFMYNRMQEQKLNDNESRSSSISTNAQLDIKPVDWLTLSASLGYNVINGRVERFQSKESFAVRSLVNRYTENTPDGLKRHIPYGNILRYDDSHSENLTTRFQMNIKKQIKDFNFGFNAGWERNAFKVQNNLGNARYNYHRQRLTEDQINYDHLASGIRNAMNSNSTLRDFPRRVQTEQRYQSVYFIGNVSYKGKYDLSGSWRLDKTNLFGQSSKYRDQPAWSVGGKWNFSEEDFFDVEWINSLALKVSYGLSGNVDKSTSPFLIGRSYNDYFTKEPALSVSNPENPLLGWEKTYTTNIGFDYALFNNRVSGSIEFYHKHSKDVLANVSLDPTNGFSQAKINNGEIVNKGIDLGVNARLIQTADFTYDLGLNFSYNHNEITKINVNSSTRNHLHSGSPVKGQAVDYLYGYKSAGVDETGEPLVYGPNGVTSWKGMSDFDLNDGTYFGRKTPPVFGSITQSFKYKNFTAGIFILYDLGHYVQQYKMVSLANDLGVTALSDIFKKRWRKAGDEKTTRVAKLDNRSYSPLDRNAAIYQSDISIDKADVVQLKSINLSYDFTSMLNSKKIKGLKLKVGIENLWHWTATDNDRVYDRMYGFPRYKNYTMGLSMQF